MRPSRRRCLAAMLGCAVICAFMSTAFAIDLLSPLVPPGAQTFDVGSEVSLDGRPTRIRGFVSMQRPDEIGTWLRARGGPAFVENRIGETRIFGRVEDRFLVTVQVTPQGAGSRGLTAVSDLRTNTIDRDARWLRNLPSGTRLLNYTGSEDAGRRSQQWLMSNGDGITANRERFLALLRDEDLALQYEGVPHNQSNARVLMFSGEGGNATVTLHRNAAGSTAIVVHRVMAEERHP